MVASNEDHNIQPPTRGQSSFEPVYRLHCDTALISDEAMQMQQRFVDRNVRKLLEMGLDKDEADQAIEKANAELHAAFIRVHRAHRRAAIIKRWLPNIAGTVLIIAGLVIYLVGSGYIPW